MSDEDSLDAGKMPLLDHLIELRRRLIYSVIALIAAWGVCYYFSQDLLDFLLQPLYRALPPGADVQYIDLTEAFFTRVKIAFWAACLIAFPVIASQVWMFVAPGLYKNEKRAFLPYLVATPVLFVLGASLAYYVIFPAAWRFFLSFQTTGGDGNLAIQAHPRVGDYLSLSMTLIFAFGVAFQMPVVLTLLARVGIIQSKQLRQYRRYAIVGNCALAALVTPPDPFSMMALAVPLWLLYEISIWSCIFVERQRRQREAALAAELGTDDPKA